MSLVDTGCTEKSRDGRVGGVGHAHAEVRVRKLRRGPGPAPRVGGPPSVRVVIVVVSVGVDWAAVHVAPPSQESSTHIRGEPDVLSTRASRRTSMPCTLAPAGSAIP